MKRWRGVALIVLGAAIVVGVRLWARARYPALDPVRDYSCMRTNRWGTKALKQMCRALGCRTKVWMKPADKVPDGAKVLLMIAPQDPLVEGEFEALRRWVRGGGRLVVAPLPGEALVYRDGKWRMTAGHYLAAWMGVVQQAGGWSEVKVVGVASNPWQAYRVRSLAVKWHAELEYVGTRSGVKRWLKSEWGGQEVEDELPPVDAVGSGEELKAGGRVGGLKFVLGDGEVVLLSEPDLLSNGLIGRADNALLAAAIVLPGAEEGAVLFDEYHHGRARHAGRRGRESGSALRGVVLLFIGTLAVYLLLGAIRMGRAHVLKPRMRRSVMEYVTAVAGLYRRAGLRDAAIEMLERAVRRAAATKVGVRLDAPAEVLGEAARARGLKWAGELEAVLRDCAKLREDPSRVGQQQLVAIAQRLTALEGEITGHGG